eukprot:31433-Pelagococcus_subviridis.AAC.3
MFISRVFPRPRDMTTTCARARGGARGASSTSTPIVCRAPHLKIEIELGTSIGLTGFHTKLHPKSTRVRILTPPRHRHRVNKTSARRAEASHCASEQRSPLARSRSSPRADVRG